jgi:hypothetical protein
MSAKLDESFFRPRGLVKVRGIVDGEPRPAEAI